MSENLALAAEVVRLATALGRTVGTAESLTAGLIAATLAEIPGASAVLMGGAVCYDPRVKREVLGVSQAVIDGPGVVSEPCARQMAEGARTLLKVDIAVSATGLAGPSGGTPETPVGTVFIGLADARGTQVLRYRFKGDRQAVRDQTVAAALAQALDSLKA
jgi:PncC family amidohydrolase